MRMVTPQERETAARHGQPATQWVRGSTRGGHVYKGEFYYAAATNIGVFAVKAEG